MKNLRACLRSIRNINTFPSHILANGKTAECTAQEYVMMTNRKRNIYKKDKHIKISKRHKSN